VGYFRYLRKVPFFGNLSDEEVRGIMSYCREDEFAPGKVVFYEGDEADRFYIVMEGEVEVWKAYGTPDADMLAVHGEGKLFGEMALVDNLPRSATVVSRGATRVLYINEQDFQRILQKNAHVALAIIRSLSSMVRKSNDSFLEDLKKRNEELIEANRKLREAQQEMVRNERLAALGKFSSMILHDIRNPISVIRAYADMLQSGESLQGKARNYLRHIRFETERLNSMANELLDYSRGEIRLDMGVVPMGQFMEEVCEYARQRITSREVEIHCEAEDEFSAMFDRNRIQRVCKNLVENARKAMGRRGTLTLRCRRDEQWLFIEVEDTGTGMSEDVLEHIYEPFYSSAEQGGTGLGMAIVKSIVETHNGHIDIASKPNEGTRVAVSLPLRL
jgi:signal transduction histidine kinase